MFERDSFAGLRRLVVAALATLTIAGAAPMSALADGGTPPPPPPTGQSGGGAGGP